MLTVEGPTAEVAIFVERVRNHEQPLTFTAHAPEPSAEVYAAIEEASKVTCDLCGGGGKRPVTAEEAKRWGARWSAGWEEMEWLKVEAALAVAERKPCNACHGEGRRASTEAWWDWRLAHWGCKWDASFDGPLIALGTSEEADVNSVAANGVVKALDMAVFRFDTPWSPPTPWLITAGSQHPELTLKLRYGEPGNDFAGEIRVHGDDYEEEDLPIADVLGPDEMWF